MYDVINHKKKTECLMVEGFKNSLLKFVTYKIYGIQSLHAYAVVSLNENSIRLYNSNGKENICQPPFFWKVFHNFISAILKILFLNKKNFRERASQILARAKSQHKVSFVEYDLVADKIKFSW